MHRFENFQKKKCRVHLDITDVKHTHKITCTLAQISRDQERVISKHPNWVKFFINFEFKRKKTRFNFLSRGRSFGAGKI